MSLQLAIMPLCSLTMSATSTGPFPTDRISRQPLLQLQLSTSPLRLKLTTASRNVNRNRPRNGRCTISCCSDSIEPCSSSAAVIPTSNSCNVAPPVKRRRKRYRKQYPGESTGITEEMRFVAMKLRNIKGKKYTPSSQSKSEEEDDDARSLQMGDGQGIERETWSPSIQGFLKYLVDSKLIFNTVERIVDESGHVAYAYFRKIGLERSQALLEDLEWFSQQGLEIPEPSNPGITYAGYLEELAEKSAPLFLCHFYNIYFSHIAGGQVISRQVSDKILEGRDLKFYTWEGDVQESLRGLREKLNMLGEHWSRDDKNKCLKEAAKSFKFLGQIICLIIL